MAPERWTPETSPRADLTPAEAASAAQRARLGAILIGLGVLGILWGVFHLLGAVGGPEQRDFAHRQTYNEVKPLVHSAMLGAFLRSFGGLALAILGASVRRTARQRLYARDEPGVRAQDQARSR